MLGVTKNRSKFVRAGKKWRSRKRQNSGRKFILCQRRILALDESHILRPCRIRFTVENQPQINALRAVQISRFLRLVWTGSRKNEVNARNNTSRKQKTLACVWCVAGYRLNFQNCEFVVHIEFLRGVLLCISLKCSANA